MSQPEPLLNKLDPLFWEERYREGTTGWDIGQPAPPLVDFIENSFEGPTGKVLVPGCGRGHEALFLARRGFAVTGVDFAPSAITFCQERAAEQGLTASTSFVQQDLFELSQDFTGQFDYVVEHTCFCAIDPALRPQYVEVIHRALKPGGRLIAVFFAHNRKGGPPYKTSVPEIKQLFSPHFKIERLEPALNSHPQRHNEELFGLLRRLD